MTTANRGLWTVRCFIIFSGFGIVCLTFSNVNTSRILTSRLVDQDVHSNQLLDADGTTPAPTIMAEAIRVNNSKETQPIIEKHETVDVKTTQHTEVGRLDPKSRTFLKGRKEVPGNDIFSASWWQRTDRFLQVNVTRTFHLVEDNAFVPILKAGRGGRDIRMARDLLDFSVEHLSKWWKDAGVATEPYVQEKCENYTKRVRALPPQDDFMKDTLAIIPYGVTHTKKLWAATLSATISSILTHQPARIVVVGHYKTDEVLARQVFGQLSGKTVPKAENTTLRYFETTIGATQVAFVHTSNVRTSHVRRNVPKGALADLSDALAGRSDNSIPYLGRNQTADRFKHIFMTEADQILIARLIPEYLKELEDGSVLVPHRIQPMLHSQDLDGLELDSGVKSTPSHKNVTELSASNDACCDTGYHQEGYRKVCKTLWFRCGYGGENSTFRHLNEYDFISLPDGIGLVALAGNQHSRKCIPMKNGRGQC